MRAWLLTAANPFPKKGLNMWWLWWPVLRQSSPRILCRDGRHWEILSRGLDMPGYVWILRSFTFLLHQRSLEKGVETAFSHGVPNGRHLCPLMTCLDQRYWIKTCNWSCELLPGPRGRNSSSYHACQVLINIYRAENLAKISGSNPNPFVTVEFGGARVKPGYKHCMLLVLYTVYTTVCYCSIAGGLNGGWYGSCPPQYHWYSLQSSKMAWAVPPSVAKYSAPRKTTPAYDVEQYTWNECARIPVQTPVPGLSRLT